MDPALIAPADTTFFGLPAPILYALILIVGTLLVSLHACDPSASFA